MKKETGNIQKNRERVYHNNTNGREDERSIMMSKVYFRVKNITISKEHHCTMIEESLHRDLTFMFLIKLQNRAKSERTARIKGLSIRPFQYLIEEVDRK